MNLSLEVTNIDRLSTALTSTTLPVTQKRTVDTTVIVKDKQTVVIGGLIEESTSRNESKIPVLGDLPVLGWMFRNTEEEGQKTNLYIFLTPRVIKSATEADSVYQEKKGTMDTKLKGGEIKLYDDEEN